jgi:hypothetical protein
MEGQAPGGHRRDTEEKWQGAPLARTNLDGLDLSGG